MSDLKSCPFCGDTHAAIVSGECAFTQPHYFMAQVHCGHCGATGTRHCGEETVELAEYKAAHDWNAATPAPPSYAERMNETNLTTISYSLMALVVSFVLFDGVHAAAIAGFAVGSALFWVTLRAVIHIKSRRAQAAHIDKLFELQG